MDRRRFISIASPLAVLLIPGRGIHTTWLEGPAGPPGEVLLRFAVASDGHFGQRGTDYQQFYATLIQRINAEHAQTPFAFTVINGDIIHDDPAFFVPAKRALDLLQMKYYVSQGNHDHCSREQWLDIWKMPVNLHFRKGRNAFLIATTSDEKGTYLCPDLPWMEQQLHHYRKMENIFIFLHINPAAQTANAVACAELERLFSRYPNIRAVFNGHDHDHDGVLIKNEIPYIFDAHFGGSWGTAYRGFRVVELLRDQTIRTYILNPDQSINHATLSNRQYAS